jgi:hypothetical protein
VVPLFYFHLRNGPHSTEDEEGVDLPSRAAARAKAIESLRGVMAGDLLMGDLNTASFIEIEDEQHEFVATISFADAVRLRDECNPGRPANQP